MTAMLWLTDLHLDAADSDLREQFFYELQEMPADFLLVGGDIGDGPLALQFLTELQKKSQKPVYFILGNHDYYGLSIDVQRLRAQKVADANPELCYLTKHGVVSLSSRTALIGHDGWADAREGKFLLSSVCLRDYFEIEDLKGRSSIELQEKLQELGQESAFEAEAKLRAALLTHQRVIFITHAPPFRSVCLYEGRMTDDLWAPHFVNKAMGDMLNRVMQEHPEKECLVLAGHSHHEAEAEILPNLTVKVAHSTYGKPTYELLTVV